jgi:hypothetical protein
MIYGNQNTKCKINNTLVINGIQNAIHSNTLCHNKDKGYHTEE